MAILLDSHDPESYKVAIMAIRLLLVRVAHDKELPFAVKVPNAVTLRAMQELEEGKGERFEPAGDLFEDLGI